MSALEISECFLALVIALLIMDLFDDNDPTPA